MTAQALRYKEIPRDSDTYFTTSVEKTQNFSTPSAISLNKIDSQGYVVHDTSLETYDKPNFLDFWKKPDREFLAVGAKIDNHGLSGYQTFDTSQGTLHGSEFPNVWKTRCEEYTTLPIRVRFHDSDNHYKISAFQIGRDAWVDDMVEYVSALATMKSIGSGKLLLHQLLERLRDIEAYKTVARIEFLASEDNIEDGEDIPAIASIDSFVTFYVDNFDLGEPLLGTTPKGELQAVWMFSDNRRLVAEFLPDDTVRYVYRRTGDLSSSKLFITSRLPRRQIRKLLDAAAI